MRNISLYSVNTIHKYFINLIVLFPILKALLTVVGLSIIGLTILVTYGLCSAFGLFFGPTHNAIPFLFLGIGMKHVLIKKYENQIHIEKSHMF